MTNGMTIFKNEEFGEIRTMSDEKSGEPWFCASDVCTALGYQRARDAVRQHVDEADAVKYRLRSGGQNRELIFLNESGLYALILSSKLPQAKQFKRWVTSDVLPSIRKNGAYMTQETINRAIREPDFLIELATNLKNEKQKRAIAEERCELLEGKVEVMEEKVSYLDLILATEDSVTITQIAQDYGMSAKAMNKLLHDMRIQYVVGKQWILYAEYIKECYVRSEVVVYNDSYGEQHTKQHTKWTQKGRLFLYRELKKIGRLPLIEQHEQPTLFDNNE